MSNGEIKTNQKSFTAKVWKTGNSFVVTVPPLVRKKMGLRKNQIVEVTIEA